MSTRTVAQRLEDLVEEASGLEQLGLPLQGEDEQAAADALAELDRKYRTWYGAALTVIPDDLAEKFRFEYDGDFFRSRIKKFLAEPRLQSGAYKGLPEETRVALNLSPWQYAFNDCFRSPLLTQKQLLVEALARIGTSSATLDGMSLLEQISRKLPIAFAVMRKTIHQKLGLTVTDEYDVQRILHAVAVLHFDEVEDEDPTPKMAGASSRLDFLLRRERVAIETKMIGEHLSVRQLRKDLAEDIQYFRAHPDAGALFVFVYDPDRKITNPNGFESDLASDSDEFPVRVVVAS